jgi:hypothetical protein
MMIIFAFLFQISLPTSAGPIIDGKEWFQPADVTGFSWNDFNAICSSGTCTGQVGGNGSDLTGYTWATVDDVNALFNGFIGSPVLSGPDSHAEIGSAWAPAILMLFDQTSDPNFILAAEVRGWLSESVPFNGRIGRVVDAADAVSAVDKADTVLTVGDNLSTGDLGAWLFREVDGTIPAPATLALFGLGLAGLGWSRRKKA